MLFLHQIVNYFISYCSWVPKLTQQEAISVFIIWENSKATVSAWKPYLSTLPKTFTTPGYFIDTELSLLPASVYKKCISEINKIRLSYDKVSKYSRNRWTDFHLILSYEVFMWAWYAINSRSVYYKQTRCEFLSDSEEDHLALAPFLDLLNHSATANVSINISVSIQARPGQNGSSGMCAQFRLIKLCVSLNTLSALAFCHHK